MGRGTLQFKGEKAKKKKSKSKVSTKNESSTLTANASTTTEGRPAPPKIQQGTGRFTSSGTVLTGHGTKFDKELRVGDAIIVKVGETDEMRVVTMCLSSVSMNVSTAFSENIIAPIPFQFIRKPRQSETAAKSGKKDAMDDDEQKFGNYQSSQVVIRERTEHGNYRIKKTTTDRELSRTELLRLRSKKTSDKYC